VLGLDPGLTSAGYGLVERSNGNVRAVEFGAIRTPRGPVPGRLAMLYERLEELISTHLPDAVAVERVIFDANARTAMYVGQAAGIALLAAARSGCEVAEYTPSEMKLSVTGDGRADKAAVQRMVAKLLDLPELPKPADAADALGLALTHLHARKLRSMQSA
jgi:crossover junction endodeoxyribonuclease RuvC